MATTNYIDYDATVPITASWLNDVDALVYDVFSAATSAASARTALSLVVGTNVQAYDASLTNLATLATAADKMLYTTGVDTYAELAVTSYGRSLIDDTSAANARTTLGVVIGTDVQAYDAELAALAGLTSAASKVPYFTGSGTADVLDVASLSTPSNNTLATHKALIVTENVTNPTYQLDIDATYVILENSSNIPYRANTVNLTVDITASGANGLDTGAEASGTWYYAWVIYNGTTVAGLLSTSSTAPTMPSGYTYKGLVGAVRNDGSSNFLGFSQRGNNADLDTVVQDVSAVTGTALQTLTLTVPPLTLAKITAERASTGTTYFWIRPTTYTDAAAAATNANVFTHSANTRGHTYMELRANASSAVSSRSDTNETLIINTMGWIWE